MNVLVVKCVCKSSPSIVAYVHPRASNHIFHITFLKVDLECFLPLLSYIVLLFVVQTLFVHPNINECMYLCLSVTNSKLYENIITRTVR